MRSILAVCLVLGITLNSIAGEVRTTVGTSKQWDPVEAGITLAKQDLIEHIIYDQDDRLLYALWNATNKKTVEDASSTFNAAYGDLRYKEGSLLNTVATVTTKLTSGVTDEIVDYALRNTKNFKEMQKLTPIQKAAAAKWVLDNMDREKMQRIVKDAEAKGRAKPMSEYIKNAEEMRKDNGLEKARVSTEREIKNLNSELEGLNKRLETSQKNSDEKALREQTQKELAEQKASEREEEEKAQKDLDLSNKRLEAGRYITNALLGPVFGAKTTYTLNKMFDSITQGRNAILQYGPKGTGLTPDRLLFTANLIQAGFTLASAFGGQAKDPVMEGLQAILEELKKIEKQLDRIEEKIDNLSELMVSGFEKVLRDTHYLKQKTDHIDKALTAFIESERQSHAVTGYLDSFVKSDFDSYRFAKNCFSSLELYQPAECINQWMQELLTEDPDYHSGLGMKRVAPIYQWSNMNLMGHTYSDDPADDIVFQELSLPFFFSNNLDRFYLMVARNQEAALNYAGISKNSGANAANPAVLRTRLYSLLYTIKKHPDLRKERTLIDNAISLVDETQSALDKTLGEPKFMKEIVDNVTRSLFRYESQVRAVVEELMSDRYENARTNFLISMKNSIPACPGEKGPQYPLPLPENFQGMNLDQYIPQIYWNAQELGLGQIGMCIGAESTEWIDGLDFRKSNKGFFGQARAMTSNFAYYKIAYRIKFFFNETNPNSSIESSNRSAPALNANSRIISIRELVTRLHYRSADITFEDNVQRAWESNFPHVGHVAECYPIGLFIDGKIIQRMAPGYEHLPVGAECIQNAYVPRKNFMTDSNEVLNPDVLDTNFNYLTAKVHKEWANEIQGYSEPWDPAHLKRTGQSGAYRLKRESLKLLKAPLDVYTQSLLLAQNIYLMGFYHQNRVSAWAGTLQQYSPINVSAWVTKYALDQPNRVVAHSFAQAMASVATTTAEHHVHPDLAKYRAELEKMNSSPSIQETVKPTLADRFKKFLNWW